MIVVFDIIGTLFSLGRLRDALRENSIPEDALQLWFARTLQASMAATLSGRYIPFVDAADASLRQVLALKGVPEDKADAVLPMVLKLDPWEDARECLSNLWSDDHQVVALTNSSIQSINALLQRTELIGMFDTILSADEVNACKPHPAPYRMVFDRMNAAPEETCMVAAHGWDIMGADAAGMRTIWVSRLEKRWPFPGNPPGTTISNLAEIPDIIFRQFSTSIF